MKQHWPAGWRVLALCGALCGVVAGCVAPPSNAGDRNPPAPLTGTHWKLIQLGNAQVSVPDSPREPHVVLQDGRAVGSGGCNRMSGGYTLDGERLKFTPMVATKMACEGAMQHEQPLFDALSKTSAWRVNGKQLELLDGSGAVVARFEARPQARPQVPSAK